MTLSVRGQPDPVALRVSAGILGIRVERLDLKPLVWERPNRFSCSDVLKRLGVKPLHLQPSESTVAIGTWPRRVLALALFPVAALGLAAEPVFANAAKTKPTNPWQAYPTRLVGTLPDYTSTTDTGLSTYGGLEAERRAATGFFRAEQAGRRWWLIDPEGHRFVHVGVVDVKHPKESGPAAAWANATTTLRRAHGFNGTGAWSDTALLRASPQPVAYTKIPPHLVSDARLGGQPGAALRKPTIDRLAAGVLGCEFQKLSRDLV